MDSLKTTEVLLDSDYLSLIFIKVQQLQKYSSSNE